MQRSLARLTLGLAMLAAACQPETEPPVAENAEISEPRGKFYTVRGHRQNPTPEQVEEMRQLESIGYAAGMEEVGSGVGVSIHDQGRSQPGLNFFASGHDTVAILKDMHGEGVHEWSCSARKARSSPGTPQLRCTRGHPQRHST